MKLLIIGYGSIGKRHSRNAEGLGHDVVLLRHGKGQVNSKGLKEYYSFADVLESEDSFDGAIICSPTSRHLNDAIMLVERGIPFLLEKPAADGLRSTQKLNDALKGFVRYDIAYNLRYYPALKFIKDFLPNLGKLYSARIQAGSYLPDWRKGVDYRNTISARKNLGGGVHLEMVHEIDYLIWFFGIPKQIFGYVNKISELEIETEDICSALLKYADGSVVELHLDYFSRKPFRDCQIVAENGTLDWSISDGKVMYYAKGKGCSEEVFSVGSNYDFNDTYVKELEHFTGIIAGSAETSIDVASAVNTAKVVEGIIVSSNKGGWVDLEEF